jgi:thiosulfate dehydrogenase
MSARGASWMVRMFGAPLALACALALAIGCGPVPAREIGAQLFADPRLSTAESNAASCQTCHSTSDDDDRLVSGRSLVDAARRERFWGGSVTSLLDATNACMTFFMRGAALEREAPASRALYEYLLSIAGEDAQPARTLTIVENVGTVGRGDPARGQEVWDRACRECHGDPHTGAGRLSETASVVPEASQEFAEQSGFSLEAVLVEKIRHGGFFGVGGVMPPFSAEALSDTDLSALIGYLDP